MWNLEAKVPRPPVRPLFCALASELTREFVLKEEVAAFIIWAGHMRQPRKMKGGIPAEIEFSKKRRYVRERPVAMTLENSADKRCIRSLLEL